MKTRLMLLIVTILIAGLPAQWAVARGSHRFALDQKWKQIQAEQQREEKSLDSIERDAERSVGDTDTRREAWPTAPPPGSDFRRR